MPEKFITQNGQFAYPGADGSINAPQPTAQTFVVAHDGDTVFTLASTPSDTDNFKLWLNGQLARLGVDYTLVTTTITWLNTIVLQAAADGKPGPNDVLIAQFYV